MFYLRLLACAFLMVLAGCGGGGSGGSGGSGAGGSAVTVDYFPLSVGDRWLYADAGNGPTRVDVIGTKTVAQGNALVVQTVDKDGTSNELYVRSANELLLLPDTGADALTKAIGPLQILRFPVVAGDHWVLVDKTLVAVEDVDGDGRPDTVAVRAEATVLGFETVVTPAGTYDQAAHVRTVLTERVTLAANGVEVTATITSDDWYAPNIGPVRNTLQVVYPNTSSTATNDVTGWRVGTRRSESVPPYVVSKTPDAGSTASGCCVSLSLQFSETMDQKSTNTSGFQLIGPDGKGVLLQPVWRDGKNVVLQPNSPLASGSYTARVTTTAQDLVGNGLATDLSWQFSVDASGPAVIPVQPLANASEVPLTTKIVFTLDEDPKLATVNASTVLLSSAKGYISVDITLVGRTVTITPRTPLEMATNYTVSAIGIADQYGNLSRGSWTFRTDPGRFAAPVSLIPTAPVTANAIGDVDGDGRNDVVMATGFNWKSPDDFSLFVIRQLPDGSFAPPQRYATHAEYGAEMYSVQVVDLDGKGRNAVVVSSSGKSIEIFRRQDDGSLSSSQVITTVASYRMRVADMNGDGRPDIIGIPFIGKAQIWYQAPDGSFGAPVVVAVEVIGWGDLAVGDISGDGRPDIVVTTVPGYPDKQFATVLQLPDGSFGVANYQSLPGYPTTRGVSIGDINGDGRNDVVIALPHASSVALLLQDAQGNLGPPTLLRSVYSLSTLTLADIDGDGRLDLVATADGGGWLELRRQRVDGSLGGAEIFPRNTGPSQLGLLSAGDVNGDGLPDIVFADAWLRQRPVPASVPPASYVKGPAGRLGLGGASRSLAEGASTR
jgi:methionine-rich copper-binding protein CopC